MQYDWDDNKNDANVDKHGIDFEAVNDFDWDTALIRIDNRRQYAEERKLATGWIGRRLYIVVYTERPGDIVRVISVRKANDREVIAYETARPK